MRWAFIEENWNDLIETIILKFPQTKRTDLYEIKGDVTAFAMYLARQHDLTVREAVETIEWSLANVTATPHNQAVAA